MPMKIFDFKSELDTYSLAVEPIYTDKVGNENTILVFLHEALGSIAQWKSFPQQLCNELQLNGIMYERRGHGASSPLVKVRDENYLQEYAWQELPTLLDRIISIDKKIILVGHSDGASIALLYAAKYPRQVIGVVSMAAHVIVEKETLAGIIPAVKAYELGKLDGLKKYHGEKTDTLFYAWADTWNLPVYIHWTICEEIESINQPVLAMQGVDDQYGTYEQLKRIETHVSGDVELEFIKNCGHHPHLEQPTFVIERILNWHQNSYL